VPVNQSSGPGPVRMSFTVTTFMGSSLLSEASQQVSTSALQHFSLSGWVSC
jgi:hypothetical protein